MIGNASKRIARIVTISKTENNKNAQKAVQNGAFWRVFGIFTQKHLVYCNNQAHDPKSISDVVCTLDKHNCFWDWNIKQLER